MPQANQFKTNFTSGEISPAALGRLDITRYKNGAEKLMNFVVRPHGGLVRRMGSRFVTEVADSSTPARVLDFQFSNEEVYVLEFGDEIIRVIKNGALVLDGGSPLEIVSPYAAEDLFEITYAQSADVIYLAHPDYPPYKLSRTNDTTWTLEEAEIEDGPYRAAKLEDKETVLRVSAYSHSATVRSQFNEFAPGDVGKFVEFYKDGYLIIGEITTYVTANTVIVEPKENVVDVDSLDKLAVIGPINSTPIGIYSTVGIWTRETEYHYIKTGGVWYYMTTHDPAPRTVGSSPNDYSVDVMLRNDTLKPVMVATTGVISIVDETITGTVIASDGIFNASTDVGRQLRMTFNRNRNVWGTITAVPLSYQASVTFKTRIPPDPRDASKLISDATTNLWAIGAWFTGNYPRAVTIHQQRLVFAGTYLEPNRVWMSESGDFVSFSTANTFAEVLDSSGVNLGIGSGEVNTISWIQSGPVLLVGTIGEEFQIKASSISEPITPSNANVTAQTPYGSKLGIKPIKIGPSTLFVQRYGISIRELIYSFEIDSFTAADITIVSEHIFRERDAVVALAYQQLPNSLMWFACDDGSLVTLTYEKEQQVFAWAPHQLGGDGLVESLCVIPDDNALQDQVYMVVRRTIDGQTKRYIETLETQFYPASPTDKDGMVYMDSFIEYSGASTTTITGLDHLEGETVQVVTNGAVQTDKTVSGGEIELDTAATQAYVGLACPCYIKTLPEEGGSPNGTVHGKTRKLVSVDVQVLDTLGFECGMTLASMDTVSFRDPSDPMGQSPPLFTGIKRFEPESGYDNNTTFYVRQTQPYPLNILSLAPIIQVNE